MTAPRSARVRAVSATMAAVTALECLEALASHVPPAAEAQEAFDGLAIAVKVLSAEVAGLEPTHDAGAIMKGLQQTICDLTPVRE